MRHSRRLAVAMGHALLLVTMQLGASATRVSQVKTAKRAVMVFALENGHMVAQGNSTASKDTVAMGQVVSTFE